MTFPLRTRNSLSSALGSARPQQSPLSFVSSQHKLHLAATALLTLFFLHHDVTCEGATRRLSLSSSAVRGKKVSQTFFYAGVIPNGTSALERGSLVLFKEAADPTGKALSTWNETLSPNYCAWEGVFCNNGGFVSHLQLSEQGLSGTISTSLSSLASLMILDLHGNLLNGPLPPSVAAIPTLTNLQLHMNNFSGPLPNTLWKPSLISFVAYGNNISGPFPSTITTAVNLRTMKVSGNRLTGSLPENIGLMRDMRSLECGQNSMQGPIPISIGMMTMLSSLSLQENQFSGPLPSQLGSCTSLLQLQLAFNLFSGSMPTFLNSLSSLQSFNLSSNQIQGPLPADVISLSGLVSLALGNNNFSGSIPESISRMSSVAILDLSNNMLNGSVPSSLSALKSLSSLRLNSNQLSGPIPDTITDIPTLQELSLSENNLTGIIPLSITRLKALTFLDVSNNNLTGGLPSSLSSIFSLGVLSVAGNPFLMGQLPMWDSSFVSLQSLNVSNCNMDGIVPSSIFDITNLTKFDLSFNYFNGTVPRNALAKVNGYGGPFRVNCLLYSNQTPAECPYIPKNGMCYLTAQRPLSQCIPLLPPSPSGVNTAMASGILAACVLVWFGVLFGTILTALLKDKPMGGCPTSCVTKSEEDDWDRMYLEGSDGAMIVADTDLPGMPPGVKRYTMDEVWTATANFSAYLDPDDLRPAFHGRLSRHSKVTVRLMPLPEEHLEHSKREFVERITAMSRLNIPNVLSFRGYAYEDGCFVAVFESAQQTLYERLHSSNKAVTGRALSWRERMRIISAVADALDCLHSTKLPLQSEGAGDGSSPDAPFKKISDRKSTESFVLKGPLIHGDIKSSNVLLTAGNRAKLFDTLVPRNPEEDPLRSVSAHGSFGYLDPNYADSKHLSPASDVYSFGVLLLEIMSGRQAMEDDSATLIVMAQDHFILREDYPKLLDPSLRMKDPSGEGGEGEGEGVPKHELVAMVEMVQTCTQVKEDSRPSMAWVREQLAVVLQMGPEEYSAALVPDVHSASEIEIEMMSEGTPGRGHEGSNYNSAD